LKENELLSNNLECFIKENGADQIGFLIVGPFNYHSAHGDFFWYPATVCIMKGLKKVLIRHQ
jgi:hypothetical protein